MRQETVRIDSSGKGFAEALALSSELAKEANLDNKESVRLRLLSEEAVGLLRGLAGDVSADLLIKQYGKEFTLQLSGDVVMDSNLHKQLIETSTSGETAAVKGFTGKLREMIATMLLPGTIGHTMVSGFSMGLLNMSSPSTVSNTVEAAQSYMWSLDKYTQQVNEKEDEKEKVTLERSILANIADEITVGIGGQHVEITIFKAF